MRDSLSQQRATALRKHLTDAEQHLWKYLRRQHLAGARFRRQVPIGPYIADFVCLTPRLVIELDGGQHAVEVAHDQARTQFLSAQGFKVLRFWNNDVLQRTEAVLAVIAKTLNELSDRADQERTPPF